MSIARIPIHIVIYYQSSQIIAQSCEITPRYPQVMGLSGNDYQLPRQFHCTGAQPVACMEMCCPSWQGRSVDFLR